MKTTSPFEPNSVLNKISICKSRVNEFKDHFGKSHTCIIPFSLTNNFAFPFAVDGIQAKELKSPGPTSSEWHFVLLDLTFELYIANHFIRNL
jgi:hypothetical protein